MMPARRPLVAWLFSLALLLGQVAAFAHALAHLHAHEPGLPDKVCELCVAQAQLGAAVPSAVLALPAAPHASGVAAPSLPAPTEPARVVARARAPPVFSA
ncbi:MAG: hypothetical protein ABS92_09500 [Thiobacillus sp. SCN 63-374]|nr:MAG: hypothetical protein ABS92_09500 [Thiobacillus sp. SCN 63-374]